MKTILISQRTWRELHRKCSEEGYRAFYPDSLLQNISALASRDSALSLVSSMRTIGLLDEDGELTKLGKKWATRDRYPEACSDIINNCFPAETCAALDNRANNRKSVIKQYAAKAGMNPAGAEKNIRFLKMLMDDSRHYVACRQDSSNANEEINQNKRQHYNSDISADGIDSRSILNHDAGARSDDNLTIRLTVPREMVADIVAAILPVFDTYETPIDIQEVP